MAKPRVLLVEDEFLIRLTLADALVDDGFDVVEAETGDEGLAVFAGSDGFALIITDIQLPGTLNGLQLGEAARARHPGLPILFMTGRPELFGQRSASAPEAVVGKPYLPSEICQAARRLIERGASDKS